MKVRSPSSSTLPKRSNLAPRSRRAEPWTCDAVLRKLKLFADPGVREKLAHFGIHDVKAYGISAPVLQKFSRQIQRDQVLAEQLWDSGIREARLLAALIGEPHKTDSAQMDRWAAGFDSWDVVDSACRYLYVFAKPAWSKVGAWSRRPEEFVKRAAFSLLAYLSYLDKESPDARFVRALRLVERESDDERNFVRKAVNWALRQIGKRNLRLNRAAIRLAERIGRRGTRAARWIACDALRELKSEAVQKRVRRKKA